MLVTLNALFLGLVFAGLPAWVAWGWVTLLKHRTGPLRARLASLAGLTFASASAALEVASVLRLVTHHATRTDGPPPLHAAGLALAGLGLVSLFGGTERAPLRWSTPALALAMLAIWALHVCSQDL